MAKVLIVGAGAAGLMAAGAAVRQGHQVTVLEHTDKPGQKILVTGKGRCNVTNDCTAEEFLHHVRTNPRFLFSSLGAFPPARTVGAVCWRLAPNPQRIQSSNAPVKGKADSCGGGWPGGADLRPFPGGSRL